MLVNTLNTNQIKNSAGTEVEFDRRAISDQKTEFKQVAETPSLPHRLNIAHQEIGSGFKKRRRSMFRFDKTVMSTVDATVPCTVSGYVVLDSPVGALTTNAEPANVLAEVMSFLANDGSNTTILYAGTGCGADVLLNGSL